MRDRFKRWKSWKKRCMNGPAYKLLVLIGVVHSPTFDLALTEEEWRRLSKSFDRSDIV